MTFNQLVKHYGSQAAAARAIAVKQPSVHAWQNTGIPDDRQLQYQNLTNGALKADRIVVKRFRELLGVAA